jgi:hypothetical protein
MKLSSHARISPFIQYGLLISGRNVCERNYNSDRRISDGNSKTLVDRDGGSGFVCEVSSSSVEFHSDNGYRTVYGKSSPKG